MIEWNAQKPDSVSEWEDEVKGINLTASECRPVLDVLQSAVDDGSGDDPINAIIARLEARCPGCGTSCVARTDDDVSTNYAPCPGCEMEWGRMKRGGQLVQFN